MRTKNLLIQRKILWPLEKGFPHDTTEVGRTSPTIHWIVYSLCISPQNHHAIRIQKSTLLCNYVIIRQICAPILIKPMKLQETRATNPLQWKWRNFHSLTKLIEIGNTDSDRDNIFKFTRLTCFRYRFDYQVNFQSTIINLVIYPGLIYRCLSPVQTSQEFRFDEKMINENETDLDFVPENWVYFSFNR